MIVTKRSRLFSGLKFMSMVNMTCHKNYVSQQKIHTNSAHFHHHCVIKTQNIFCVRFFDEFSGPHSVLLRLLEPAKTQNHMYEDIKSKQSRIFSIFFCTMRVAADRQPSRTGKTHKQTNAPTSRTPTAHDIIDVNICCFMQNINFNSTRA